MFRLTLSALMLSLLACAVANAEDPKLIASGAELEKLADGFQFTEGPAADRDGNIFFSDIPNERIHKWSVADSQLSLFREKSGRANGLYFDRDGNLIACEGGSRKLTTTTPAGETTVLAETFNGKKLNSPNDLWIDQDSGVYFTDPRYGDANDLQQDGFHVYYLSADRKTLTRVIDDFKKPNGLIGTADNKRLYVADAGGNKTYVFDIVGPGELANRKQVAAEGSDGMTLDEHGNFYLTRGAVKVYSPAGKLILTIKTPESPANVTFGGKDRKTLFITARTGFYSIKMNVRGQIRHFAQP